MEKERKEIKTNDCVDFMHASNVGRKSPKGSRVNRRKKYKRRSRKTFYGIVAVVIVFFCILTYSFLRPTNQMNISQEFSHKAAIVDHLSLYQPNPNFNQTASAILEEAGFTVDYYPSEEVTVNFFRNLPKHDYGLLILRVHSGIGVVETDWVCLFTSERYTRSKYVNEQLAGRIMAACYQNPPEPPYFFGINPDFIRLSTKGTFQNTIVLMMGCDGLRYPTMAEAFIKKGAKAYISWDKAVSASHTDEAIIHLLRQLVIEKQTIEKAVSETNKEVGPDPLDGSILLYYPDSANNNVIPSVASNLILKDSKICMHARALQD
jgi:hypothetical protein